MPMADAAVEQTDQRKAKVFISYSRKDIEFADRLEAALRGFEPLIDRTDIYAFEEWWERIEALVTRADTVVFVLSPDAVASEAALREVGFAASLNKRFAPDFVSTLLLLQRTLGQAPLQLCPSARCRATIWMRRTSGDLAVTWSSHLKKRTS
jgi:TIR domain